MSEFIKSKNDRNLAWALLRRTLKLGHRLRYWYPVLEILAPVYWCYHIKCTIHFKRTIKWIVLQWILNLIFVLKMFKVWERREKGETIFQGDGGTISQHQLLGKPNGVAGLQHREKRLRNKWYVVLRYNISASCFCFTYFEIISYIGF